MSRNTKKEAEEKWASPLSEWDAGWKFSGRFVLLAWSREAKSLHGGVGCITSSSDWQKWLLNCMVWRLRVMCTCASADVICFTDRHTSDAATSIASNPRRSRFGSVYYSAEIAFLCRDMYLFRLKLDIHLEVDSPTFKPNTFQAKMNTSKVKTEASGSP